MILDLIHDLVHGVQSGAEYGGGGFPTRVKFLMLIPEWVLSNCKPSNSWTYNLKWFVFSSRQMQNNHINAEGGPLRPPMGDRVMIFV